MTAQPNYWLIATDLDGTLLDDSYDYAAAATAIDAVTAEHNAQLVLASSKTLVEMLQLAERCATDPLLVFENGAGIAWSTGQLTATGTSCVGDHQVISNLPMAGGYPALRALLTRWREESGYHFTGFGDCTNEQVAAMTGLRQSDAALARQRLGTEPLLWQDSADRLKDFQTRLNTEGLQLVSGGRFLHVMPPGGKADAVAWVTDELTANVGSPAGTIACGDAANDLEMLQKSDIALVFPNASGDYLLPASSRVHQICAPGPATWHRAINRAINQALASAANTSSENDNHE